MKYVAALLMALCVAPVHADAIAKMDNAAGGAIVLTDVTSNRCFKETYIAYSAAPRAKTIFGCWHVDDEYVHIMWAADDVRSYKLEDFRRITKKGNKV